MVTGRPPASADNTIEILMQHVNGLKLDYSATKLPAWLQACLKHALAKDRELRYSSMGDFAESLRDRTDKKGATSGSGDHQPFAYDPVVQTGVSKPGPGEEGKVADEVVRGIGIGCLLVGLGYAIVHLFYAGLP
jgi:hypothetical protein